MNGLIEMRRHLSVQMGPEGIVPTYCAESVSQNPYTFRTSSAQEPPDSTMFNRYPADFLGYVSAWISDFTKYLWAKKARQKKR